MTRHLFALGHTRPEAPTITAVRCGWCRRWSSFADMRAAHNGATVSHGICKSCAAKMLREAGIDPNGSAA